MQFNEYLSSVLDKISQKYCYICGDFNINLLNIEKHSLSNKFLDIFLENGYYPLITHPTRITSNSATLIDNIYTNVLNKNISSGLFITDISDHLPNFQITYELLVTKDTNDQHLKSYLIRDISDERLSEFKHKISNIQWDNILNGNNPNSQYNDFIEVFQKIYNDCFPLKELKTSKHIDKKWMTNSLINACKKKNMLYKQFLHLKTQESELRYKQYKNKLTSII